MARWLLLFLCFSSPAFSQQLIEGRIIDQETGKPIPFASIGIVGTSRGTSSNLNGQFSLLASESASLKISCVGYESRIIESLAGIKSIELKPIATQLNPVVVFNKAINPKKIVRRAFANIRENFSDEPFLQKFFYRHYCKDDSVYGRLIEASADVWKHRGYHAIQKFAGEKEEMRITQLRRSVDKTLMAQGHEPISLKNILQADVVGYQTVEKSPHLSFYTDVSNLWTDMDGYSFAFNGITTYDGDEVYQINYTYKKDSALTSSGGYVSLCQVTGSLFITTDNFAFVKTEEVKTYGRNTIRTSAYYRKYDNRYYPYHFIREGESHTSDSSTHSFHIELMSVEIRNNSQEKFTGREPGKEELLAIPYDSIFWNNSTILKTTPLEDAIILDLGGGASLNKQFYLYQQHEMNLRDGGNNGEGKFNWLREDSKGKRILYLFFWSSDFGSYLIDLELAKRLNKQYRNKITFVFLSLEEDEIKWKETVARFNLFSDGIINYRIGRNSSISKAFEVKDAPAFILISRSGELFDPKAKRPSNPELEKDFKLLLE
jgi:hypothetical protein